MAEAHAASRWCLLAPLGRVLGQLEALERELRRVTGLCRLLEEMRGAQARRRTSTATATARTEHAHG